MQIFPSLICVRLGFEHLYSAAFVKFIVQNCCCRTLKFDIYLFIDLTHMLEYHPLCIQSYIHS